jgi:hypothetical protein
MGEALAEVSAYFNTSASNVRDVGYAVIPNLLSSDEAQEVYELVGELDLHGSQVQVPGASSNRKQANERTLLGHEILRELLTRPRLVEAVTAALDTTDWRLLAYEAIEIAPRTGKARDWHCDFHYQSENALVVNTGIYLLDMVESNGPLFIIPGSHRRECEPTESEVESMLPGEIPLLVPAGSAVVFHGRTWHTSSSNLSEQPRRALFAYFGHDWISRMDDFYRRPLPDDILKSSDPLTRKMFGLDGGTLVHGATYTRDNEDWL